MGSSYTFYYYYFYKVSTIASTSDDSSIIKSRYQSVFSVGGDWTRILIQLSETLPVELNGDSSYTWCNFKQYYTAQYFVIGYKFWQIHH